MAVTSKALFRGAAAISSTTLYTVPSETTAIVTSILVTNTAASAATFDLLLNDVAIADNVAISANDTINIDTKQVVATTETIKGLASAITVNFHISGVEIV